MNFILNIIWQISLQRRSSDRNHYQKLPVILFHTTFLLKNNSQRRGFTFVFGLISSEKYFSYFSFTIAIFRVPILLKRFSFPVYKENFLHCVSFMPKPFPFHSFLKQNTSQPFIYIIGNHDSAHCW